MQGFIQAQAFGIGPIQHARANTGHLPGIGQRHELDVLRAALRLDALDERRQRVAHPGNHHRPALHAAQAVDTLFHRGQLEQGIKVKGARFVDQALYLNRPRSGLERVCPRCRVGLAGAEFVEVVVLGDVLVRRELFGGECTIHRTALPRQGGEAVGACRALGKGLSTGPRQARGSSGRQPESAREVGLSGRDVAAVRVLEAVDACSNQHKRSFFKRTGAPIKAPPQVPWDHSSSEKFPDHNSP